MAGVDIAPKNSPGSPPVDWTGVRRVYKMMQDLFYLVTEPFGIQLTSSRNRDLAHLIAGIDSLDRNLDILEELDEREEFSHALIQYLNGQSASIESMHATAEVSDRMMILKEILVRRKIQTQFCETAGRVLKLTEQKRLAATETDMIRYLKEEWRLTGDLPVMIMGDESNERFERFFFLCCEMMTAVDMIQDARADFREGQISVRPSLTLYLRLLGVFLLPMPVLLWRFPNPLNLFRYAWAFLWHVYGPGDYV